MFRLIYNSLQYVIKEHISNSYRISTIVKYELMAEYRDSKLGIWWAIIHPSIQILAYWFAFGLGIRGGAAVNEIPYINWMLAGIIPWFFISDTILSGTNAIYRRIGMISKMKFPISILPTTEVLKALWIHLITLLLGFCFMILNQNSLSFLNLNVIYYLICTVLLAISFSFVSSVLNMLTRDVKKGITASMRLLLYVTPVLWTMDKLPMGIQQLMKLNPFYYIIQGYRGSLLSRPDLLPSVGEGMIFFMIVILLFVTGSFLMYKFQRKFIDFI